MEDTEQILAGSNSAGKSQIFSEQIRLLYGSTNFGCVIQLVVVSTLALAQFDFAPHSQIAAILAYFTVVILIRLCLNYAYNRQSPDPEQTQKWANYYTIAVALTGIGWMAAAYIFITTPNPISISPDITTA